MEEAKVTSKGQITIPKRIREALGLEKGIDVTFILEGNEAIIMPKVKNPIKELVKLRKEIKNLFTEKEIQIMIKEKNKDWEKRNDIS